MSANPQNPIPVPTTPAEFRALAPGFADPAIYLDADIQMWLTVAGLLLTCRWGNLLGVGTTLFVEHNLALNLMIYPNGYGSPPVQLRGPVLFESAGSISVSYDMADVLNKNAGWWNYTPYGQKFYWLMNLVGMGPIQLNVPPWGGICGGAGGAFDQSALARAGLAGLVGPGWFKDDANVPVGKYLPQTGPEVP